MPDDQKEPFLEYLRETLETHVGVRLARGMNEQKLDEFERLIEARNEQGALAWLEANCPDYASVVTDEMNNLKNEVITSRDDILSASLE